jgi:hypothetical protein
MDHLKNILLGMGEVLTAFGTAPEYKYPKIGDRSADKQRMRRDLAIVGNDMRTAATRVTREAHVKVEDSAAKRQGSTTHRVGSRNRLAAPADWAT